MEGRKMLTIVFNSKSKSPAIPAALKIAMLYQHEIKEDGYCHVFFDNWDPDLEKLLDLVDGLKGTLLLDQEKRQFRSKYDYEISIKWDEEKNPNQYHPDVQSHLRK